MKIAKGSSFATWTKRLQGKGGWPSKGKNKSKSNSSSFLGKTKMGENRRSKQARQEAAERIEERVDRNRNDEVASREIQDQRDDVAAEEVVDGGSVLAVQMMLKLAEQQQQKAMNDDDYQLNEGSEKYEAECVTGGVDPSGEEDKADSSPDSEPGQPKQDFEVTTPQIHSNEGNEPDKVKESTQEVKVYYPLPLCDSMSSTSGVESLSDSHQSQNEDSGPVEPHPPVSDVSTEGDASIRYQDLPWMDPETPAVTAASPGGHIGLVEGVAEHFGEPLLDRHRPAENGEDRVVQSPDEDHAPDSGEHSIKCSWSSSTDANSSHEETDFQTMTTEAEDDSQEDSMEDIVALDLHKQIKATFRVFSDQRENDNIQDLVAPEFWLQTADSQSVKVVANANTEQEGQQSAESPSSKEYSTVESPLDTLQSLNSKDSKFEEKGMTLKGDDKSLFESQDVERDITAAKPPRRFSKPKLAAWAGKRSTKHQQEDKELVAEKCSPLPPLPTTMKYRMLQEKKALGRVTIKSKKGPKSLLSVGEIISSAGSTPTPLHDDITSKNSIIAVPETTTKAEAQAKPVDTNMSDMIWWSNEKPGVEIIAVKSDEFAKAWNEEEESRTDGNLNLKEGAAWHDDAEEPEVGADDGFDGIDREDFVHDQRLIDDGQIARSRRKQRKANGKKGKKKEKVPTGASVGAAKIRRRERQRDDKEREKADRSLEALVSMASDLTDVEEKCACNDEVIRDTRALCGDREVEEAGCRDISSDLREMAKELIRGGPTVLVEWLV